VKERHRFGVGRADFVRTGHFGEKVWKEDRALGGRVVDDEHVLKVDQGASLRCHPPAEEACCRDEHSALADLEALAYRIGPKCREEGTQNAAVLERTERGDIKLGDPWQEYEDPVPDTNPQVVQRLRKAARELRQLTVCDVAHTAISLQTSERYLLAGRTDRVAVNGFVSDIDPTSRQTVQRRASGIPAETGARRIVIDEVRQ